MTGPSHRAAEICGELAELVSRHGSVNQKLADASNRDMSEAARVYQTLDMWGGMGSFADEAGVELDADGRRRVNNLLIELYEEFERHGIHYPRADQWVDVFRWWRDDDVFRNPPS